MILVPLLNPKFAIAFAAPCMRASGSGALGMRTAGGYFSLLREWFVRVRGFESLLKLRKSP